MRQLLVVDAGLRDPRVHLAYGQALVDAHRAGRVGDVARFMTFPPSAIVGRHQILAREVDVAACHARGVRIARRITGGGAVWMEPAILGWELALDRRALGVADLVAAAARIGEAVAHGLAGLGIQAEFRARNDIEVDGRKLCGTGGFADGNSLFFQGTVLADLDVEGMAAVLRLPAAKLGRRGLAAIAERVTTLRELLGAAPLMERIQAALLAGWGDRLGYAPASGELPLGFDAEAVWIHDEEVGRDDFVDEPYAPDGPDVRVGEHRAPGGTIRAHLRLRPGGARLIQDVLIEGDFFVSPARVIPDLEAALRDAPAERIVPTVEAFFSARPDIAMLGLAPADVARAVVLAASEQDA